MYVIFCRGSRGRERELRDINQDLHPNALATTSRVILVPCGSCPPSLSLVTASLMCCLLGQAASGPLSATNATVTATGRKRHCNWSEPIVAYWRTYAIEVVSGFDMQHAVVIFVPCIRARPPPAATSHRRADQAIKVLFQNVNKFQIVIELTVGATC
jgi:hypothetical protein